MHVAESSHSARAFTLKHLLRHLTVSMMYFVHVLTLRIQLFVHACPNSLAFAHQLADLFARLAYLFADLFVHACQSTQAPVSLTVNLARPCNVERIIVRKLFLVFETRYSICISCRTGMLPTMR